MSIFHLTQHPLISSIESSSFDASLCTMQCGKFSLILPALGRCKSLLRNHDARQTEKNDLVHDYSHYSNLLLLLIESQAHHTNTLETFSNVFCFANC